MGFWELMETGKRAGPGRFAHVSGSRELTQYDIWAHETTNVHYATLCTARIVLVGSISRFVPAAFLIIAKIIYFIRGLLSRSLGRITPQTPPSVQIMKFIFNRFRRSFGIMRPLLILQFRFRGVI